MRHEPLVSGKVHPQEWLQDRQKSLTEVKKRKEFADSPEPFKMAQD